MSKTINCVIIDDEPLAIEVIKAHLSQFQDISLVSSFRNPLDAYETLKNEDIALLFLDIEMPLLSGIDFLKSLPQRPKVILTTAYRNYAVEGYELDVIDYLLKPISFQRFFKAIHKFKQSNNAAEPVKIYKTQEAPLNDHIYVNVNKRFVKIEFSQIEHIESIKDYVQIHTSEEQITTKDSISNFEQKLPKYFLRVHRSYIVNSKKITAFTKMDVEIGTKEIPIGNSYKEKTLQFLQE